jgi:NTE family protein
MVETRNVNGFAEVRASLDDQTENFGGYLRSILGFLSDVSTENYLHEDDWKRTVFIEAHGVRTTDFNISKKLVNVLLGSGAEGVDAHFSREIYEPSP